MNHIDMNKTPLRDTEDDGGSSAKGLVNGITISVIFWIVIIFIIYGFI